MKLVKAQINFILDDSVTDSTAHVQPALILRKKISRNYNVICFILDKM